MAIHSYFIDRSEVSTILISILNEYDHAAFVLRQVLLLQPVPESMICSDGRQLHCLPQVILLQGLRLQAAVILFILFLFDLLYFR
jgi:hypothetical protein